MSSCMHRLTFPRFCEERICIVLFIIGCTCKAMHKGALRTCSLLELRAGIHNWKFVVVITVTIYS